MKALYKVPAVLLGMGAYLGLAALGEGGWSPLFVDPALLALMIEFVLMSLVALFVGGNLSTGVQEDRGNRWVLFTLIALGFLLAWLPAYTDRIGFWVIDGEATRWWGVVVCAVGGVFRLWPVYVLGNRFSGLVAIQPEHSLVTHGIYRRIRHPSYLGLVLTSGGWALAFRSGVGLVITALTTAAVLLRIRSEEALLRQHFGREYDDYCTRTWRMEPGIY